jgi:hypothetical protein
MAIARSFARDGKTPKTKNIPKHQPAPQKICPGITVAFVFSKTGDWNECRRFWRI